MKTKFCFTKTQKINNEIRYYIENTSNLSLSTIFNLNNNFDFSILEINYDDNINVISEEIVEVSDRLHILIDSAKQYPPAIALTDINIMHYCKKLNKFSIEQVENLAILLLDEYLENQNKLPFFMARCKSEYFSFLVPNKYYWIVGYNKDKNKISWVSDDYFIYEDDLEEFDIKPKLLKKLEGYPKKALEVKMFYFRFLDSL